MSCEILLLTLLSEAVLREARGSQLSLPRVPVPLKIDNQLIAKMQERLLEGVRCQILAQCFQWLGLLADRLAVGRQG